jgi:arylsulfatase
VTGRWLRAAAIGVAGGAVLGLWLWASGTWEHLAWLWPAGPWSLPARIEVERTTADLTAAFDPAAVVAAAPGRPVRVETVATGRDTEVNAGARRAIVAPAPARLAFPVAVPAEGVLRFGAGLVPAARRPKDATGVRFAVSIDGREVWTRTLDVAASDRDRGWHEEEVDLGPWAERRVTIGLDTAPAGAGTPSGTPAWTHVRVLREAERTRQDAAPDAPSVLVLLVDTLRADRVGAYGAHPTRTPNLDQLAAAGLVFDDAVSQSSWTMLSVPSLMTGLHPHSHGVWGKLPGEPATGADTTSLPDALPTLAETAELAGITTVAVSTNPLVSRGNDVLRGFESVVEFGTKRRYDPAGTDLTWARAPQVHEAFRAWLRQNRGRRFLAWLHYMEPHRPYTPPADLRPPVPPGVRPEVARGRAFALAQAVLHGGPPLPAVEVDYLRALYDAEVRAWDRELPALLAMLDDFDVRRSTIIVVTADHGEEFQEHGHLKHGTHLYDETIRVPLIIAGPGIVPRRSPVLAQGIDLFPTLAAVLGIAPPRGLPGQDLLARPADRPAVSETGDGTAGYLVGIRTRTWKLIRTPARGRAELYDLVADPGEHHDLSGADPEGARLGAALDAWAAHTPGPPAPSGHDPRVLEKLRALGYVE